MNSHRVRRAVREIEASDGDWRSVVDGLRRHTARLWRSMPIAQRQRFLARLRPFWEVHRHRMATEVARSFQALVDRGEVRWSPAGSSRPRRTMSS